MKSHSMSNPTLALARQKIVDDVRQASWSVNVPSSTNWTESNSDPFADIKAVRQRLMNDPYPFRPTPFYLKGKMYWPGRQNKEIEAALQSVLDAIRAKMAKRQ